MLKDTQQKYRDKLLKEVDAGYISLVYCYSAVLHIFMLDQVRLNGSRQVS